MGQTNLQRIGNVTITNENNFKEENVSDKSILILVKEIARLHKVILQKNKRISQLENENRELSRFILL